MAVKHEFETRLGKQRRDTFGIESEVLLECHAVDEPHGAKDSEDAVDVRARNGEDEPTARSQRAEARLAERLMGGHRDVLEHGKRRDAIELVGAAIEVCREATWDEPVSRTR